MLGLAGPVTSEILELQIVRLMVFAGHATDEILRLHFVWLVVFARPTSNRIIVLQIVTFVVLTGLATNEIWEPLFARFVLVAGPGWACHKWNFGTPDCEAHGLCSCHGWKFEAPFCKAAGVCWACLVPVTKFSYPRLPGLSSWLGLPRTKLWNPSDCGSFCSFGALVCSTSKMRWLCWPHWLALVCLFCAVQSFSGSETIWLDSLVGLSLCCCFLWNEWDIHVYESMVLRRNECSSSLGDGFTFLGSMLPLCGAVLRGLWAAFLFHLLLCSFCCFTALFPEGTVLLLYLVCFLVPRIYFLLSLRAISERIGESPVCDLR